MRFPFSRTRAKLIHRTKKFIYEKTNFQQMIELEEKQRLEDSMGFRGQWDEHRRFQIEFLKKDGLLPSDKLLELGCGPLTAGIPLIGYLNPGNYVGVDVRSSVLDLCWREVAKAKLSAKNPRLICSQSFGRDFVMEKFDRVYSFSVLYHLNDQILDAYFSAVSQCLKPDGHCLANVNTVTASDTWLEFPFLRREIESYALAAGRYGLKCQSLGTIKHLGFKLEGAEKDNAMLRFSPKLDTSEDASRVVTLVDPKD